MAEEENLKKRRGRPAGSPNVDTVIDVPASRCPICQSTRRSEYEGRMVQPYAGMQNGSPYTHIVRRRTRCLDCGQVRIDRTFENHPANVQGE